MTETQETAEQRMLQRAEELHELGQIAKRLTISHFPARVQIEIIPDEMGPRLCVSMKSLLAQDSVQISGIDLIRAGEKARTMLTHWLARLGGNFLLSHCAWDGESMRGPE